MVKRPSSSSGKSKKDNHKNNKSNSRDKKRGPAAKASFVAKSKREIVFDPEARKAYLQGFSERKRQRRAYGLAMQKVKDRKAKLEERKQLKKDELQRVEEAERQKAAIMEEMLSQQQQNQQKGASTKNLVAERRVDKVDESGDEGCADGIDEVKQKNVLDHKTYDDQITETHWGGRVTVTTSVVDIDDGDSSDDDEDQEDESPSRVPSNKKKSVDRQQQYAGKVEKFMSQLKGNMPGKKKSKDATGHHAKRKGKNGAADMKGIGGAANLKLAQKVLSKAKAKHGSTSKDNKKGGKKKSRR